MLKYAETKSSIGNTLASGVFTTKATGCRRFSKRTPMGAVISERLFLKAPAALICDGRTPPVA
jgi:hypothetical protein